MAIFILDSAAEEYIVKCNTKFCIFSFVVLQILSYIIFFFLFFFIKMQYFLSFVDKGSFHMPLISHYTLQNFKRGVKKKSFIFFCYLLCWAVK